MLETRCQPAFRLGSIQESGCPVPELVATAERPALLQRLADLAAAMSQLHQGQNVLLLAVFPYNGHSGGLAARIDLDRDVSVSALPYK
jgi:hypothetical protein